MEEMRLTASLDATIFIVVCILCVGRARRAVAVLMRREPVDASSVNQSFYASYDAAIDWLQVFLSYFFLALQWTSG